MSLTVKLVPLDLTWLGLGTLVFSYGSFAHAFTFPCTDAAAEIGGQTGADDGYMGTAVYIVCTAFLFLAVQAPPAEGWPLNDAYVALFQGGPRIILGSLLATLSAQLWDIYVFEWVKKRTGEKNLWLQE